MQGKRVFFLHPHSVIQDEMLQLFIAAEVNVSLIWDHAKTLRVLRKFPDSLLFVNIDEGLEESKWELFISSLMKHEPTKNVRIGVLSYNEDFELAQKYLVDVGVQCGFIVLKLGLKESAKILMKTLDANEVRGRRAHIRVNCRESDRATCNFKLKGGYVSGKILDISSAGFACLCEEIAGLKVGTSVNDIQLKLGSVLCLVSGKVLGTQERSNGPFVVMFDFSRVSTRERQKILQFVYQHNQREIDEI